MRKLALMSVILSTMAWASAPGHATTTQSVVWNTNIRSNLGMTAYSWGTIESAMMSALSSWTANGGSEVLYVLGSPTNPSACASGRNGIAADNTTCSGGCAPATITFCGTNNVNWFILLHKQYTGANWGIGSNASGTADFQGALTWALGQILTGQSASGSTCLTQSSPTTTELIQYRDAFCNQEVEYIRDPGVSGAASTGFQGDNTFFMTSTGWPTPTSWTGSTINTYDFTGPSGFDIQRGYTADGGGEYFVNSSFHGDSYYNGAIPTPLEFKDFISGITYSNDITSQTANTVRRPAIAYDSSRKRWVLAAVSEGSSDQVNFWYSSDQMTWTSLSNESQIEMCELGVNCNGLGTDKGTNIYTRKPFQLFYDAHMDDFDIVWSNADPSAGPLTGNDWGLTNEMAAAWIRADMFYGETGIWSGQGSGVVINGGPAIACNDTEADSCGTVTDPNCMIVYNVATGALDMQEQDWLGETWNSPCSYDGAFGFKGSPYSISGSQQISNFSPSIAFAHNSSTSSTMIVACSLNLNRWYLELNTGSMPSTGGSSASNWGGFNTITDAWAGTGTQLAPYGTPVIRSSVDQSNYIIVVQSATGSAP